MVSVDHTPSRRFSTGGSFTAIVRAYVVCGSDVEDAEKLNGALCGELSF